MSAAGIGAGKVVLITGANRGIGFGTARRMGELGFKVLLGARDNARGAKAAEELRADHLDVEFIKMDLSSTDSIKAAAATVTDKYKRLDVLINNAAIMDFENEVFPMNMDRMKVEMETNFYATVSVTDTFLPILLGTSDAPRIVFVSTPLGTHETVSRPQNKYANPSFTAYKCSKAAVNMYAHNLAYWLETSPEEAGGSAKAIKVNAVYPGYVKTDMSFQSADAKLTPYDGAESSVRLATLPADGPTGGFYHLDKLLPW